MPFGLRKFHNSAGIPDLFHHNYSFIFIIISLALELKKGSKRDCRLNNESANHRRCQERIKKILGIR